MLWSDILGFEIVKKYNKSIQFSLKIHINLNVFLISYFNKSLILFLLFFYLKFCPISKRTMLLFTKNVFYKTQECQCGIISSFYNKILIKKKLITKQFWWNNEIVFFFSFLVLVFKFNTERGRFFVIYTMRVFLNLHHRVIATKISLKC